MTIGTSTLVVDSLNSYVGINKSDPSSTLDISGDVSINNSLTTTGIGTGPGFGPVGTIIMWPTDSGPDASYGTWALCDGNNTTYSINDFPDLTGLLSQDGDYWKLPDYTNHFIRGASDGQTSVQTVNKAHSGNINLGVNNLPFHNHNIPAHNHTITNNGHTHNYPDHNHTITTNSTTNHTYYFAPFSYY